jgi:hypothetical protein
LGSLVVVALIGLTVAVVSTSSAGGTELTVRMLDGPIAEAQPPLPLGTTFPIQLVADDGTAEGVFGVSGTTSRPFLWFQSFDAPSLAFDLEEIWVQFPVDPQVSPGAPVQLVVYRDVDGNPGNGAQLLAAVDTTVQVADGVTFSVYPLAAPLRVLNGGQILIGVVSRYANGGVTPPSQPASLDVSSSLGGSWVATWIGDPPDPPTLPSDQTMFLIDTLVPGNWMIRGFGTNQVAAQASVPALGELGVALLVVLLAAAGWRLLR